MSKGRVARDARSGLAVAGLAVANMPRGQLPFVQDADDEDLVVVDPVDDHMARPTHTAGTLTGPCESEMVAAEGLPEFR